MIANTKSLVSAIPSVDTSTGFVTEWRIEVLLTKTGSGDAYSNEYPHIWKITSPSKEPSAYTQAEILGSIPANYDEIFSHHYDVSRPDRTPPVSVVNDFDVNSLASGGGKNK